MRAHEAAGTTYDLVLLGNDAADTGDFQVGIRLAYLLDRPGRRRRLDAVRVEVTGWRRAATARTAAPRSSRSRCRRSPTVMEGGVEPRYPSIPGRMKAKKVAVEEVAPTGTPAGPGRVRLKLPPPQPSQVEVLGEGAEAAAPSSTCWRSWGCCDESSVLVLVETDGGAPAEVSREALTFARGARAIDVHAARRR